MELNENKCRNPFPGIVQHLTYGDDKRELRNLRQVSTLCHQILNPKYFDKAQWTIQIKKSENKILNGPRGGVCFPQGRQMKTLRPENWDPITFAPTIRRLVLSGNQLDYLLSLTNSTMIGGFDPLELIAQISPYITTLDLDLEDNRTFLRKAKVSDFLQQFVNLKLVKLRNGWSRNESDLLISFSTKIDEIPGEFEIELVSRHPLQDGMFLSDLFSAERDFHFRIKNHKFSLNIPFDPLLCARIETGNWARIFTYTNNNSVSVKKFGAHIDISVNTIPSNVREVEKNQILHDLSIISQNVDKLVIRKTFEEMDNLLFSSWNWPRLKKLFIHSPTLPLIGFSTTCPNLEKLTLTIIESKSLFTNSEVTDEYNLNQIFGNCSKTLKKLKFKQWNSDWYSRRERQYLDAQAKMPKMTPGSQLIQYLQELLPNTLIVAEEYVPLEVTPRFILVSSSESESE